MITQKTTYLDFSNVSKYQWNFNGSLFILNKQRYVCYRCQNQPTHRSYLAVSQLGADHQPTSFKQLKIPMKTCEDPRAVVKGDTLYVFYNSGAIKSDDKFSIFCAQFDANFQLIRNTKLTYGQGGIEKNWVPFYAPELGKWCCVYSVNPWIVLQFDDDWTGTEVINQQFNVPWRWGRISGGSPAYFVPPPCGFSFVKDFGFYMWFHSRYQHPLKRLKQPSRYVGGLLQFSDTPPFKPMAISNEPLLIARHKSAVSSKVVFPSGAIFDGTKWIISSGSGDETCRIDELDHDECLTNLLWTRLTT